ncbi:M15 family metallopeptidase [Cumulibacter soli]|uniref:M15 family metallopeptidase n=1 Tax=Cumulibacter soli TaxID=2546344 RepID=UPI001068A963|nr:M15 family metallopeptidase [Cumulibacter soli]
MTQTQESSKFGVGALTVLGLILVVLSIALGATLMKSVDAEPRSTHRTTTNSVEPTGAVPDGEYLDITKDAAHAAIARLDPQLKAALQGATAAAAQDGVTIGITSGWRAEAYQAQLMEEEIDAIGAAEAKKLVADPSTSHHVTGHAVDIGPMSATDWLAQRGVEFGLCQIYANESWHYELATTPGGTCPPMKSDATES